MKLRNRKTGEILEEARSSMTCRDNFRIYDERTNKYFTYDSLTKLNAEWEDYEEPKDFWYIDEYEIMCGTEGEVTMSELASFTKRDIERLKAIGNYFETKEEAEKAVKKLEAWKRLKDKGFRFERWIIGGEYGNTITFSDYIDCNNEKNS